MTDHRQHLDRFYDLLSILQGGMGGTRRLCDCTGKMPWPERGVYFFFEAGELRADDAVFRLETRSDDSPQADGKPVAGVRVQIGLHHVRPASAAGRRDGWCRGRRTP